MVHEVWVFTAERWGVDQAERYLRTLQEAFESLADAPLQGRACDEIRRGYRHLPVGSHVPFYRVSGETVTIVRILHQRTDVAQHLENDAPARSLRAEREATQWLRVNTGLLCRFRSSQ